MADDAMAEGVLGKAGDLLRQLPESFATSYLALLGLCYNDLPSGRSVENPVGGKGRIVRVSTGQTETRGPAKSGGRIYPVSSPIRSDSALREMRKINMRLRRIARDIDGFLAGDDVVRSGKRRCSRCNAYADAAWVYCPRDGAPTEEDDG